MYYKEKIKFLHIKFIELFKKMLIQKGYTEADELFLLCDLAYKVKQFYPNKKRYITNVVILFTEEKDSEEKLEDLLNLYKVIMEGVNE